MLNKQGIFNRRNQPEESYAPALSSLSQMNAQDKLNSQNKFNAQNKNALAPTPGHLAAMESTTSLSNHASTTSDTKSSGQTSDISKSDPIGGSRLIVGPDVKLKGAEIEDCDTLVVEGRVEATMDSRVIQITQNGSFSGKVGIDVAEIYGSFDGELTARSQLIIHSSGRVSGKIRYGKIHIEEGGELSGDIGSIHDKDAVSKLSTSQRLSQASTK
ncbi:MAG: polymer-forming cytoskeletal protein [Nitrosomonadales bacterium]|nr:polymer-forming cytoskeletal protein [Nitrosomonadales bacterium]